MIRPSRTCQVAARDGDGQLPERGHGPVCEASFKVSRIRRARYQVCVMAEICCRLLRETEASTDACEPSARAARRRRMDNRRFRFVAGTEVMASSDEFRRRKHKDRSNCAVEKRSDHGSGSDNEASLNSISSSNLEPDRASSVESAVPHLCSGYGMTSVCGRRRDMEDAVSIRPDLLGRDSQVSRRYHFFGVYDGHGCSHVAASCKDRMHEMVAEELQKLGSGPPLAENWKEIMNRSFSRMDAEAVAYPAGPPNPNCRCELRTPECDHVGSTAVVAVVSSDRIVVANCGDSRAVLCRNGVSMPLSSDHKPDRPDELQRIQAAGGRVIYWEGARVLGVLAMSRAIGDNYLKPFVISEPEVTVTERTEEDECLILASDGLWDVVSNETACSIVRMCLRGNNSSADGADVATGGACSDAALLLTKLALARQSSDNVSVVVVDLRRNLQLGGKL